MEYSNELLGQLREKAKRLRRGVIECIGVGNAGHVGGGCSCADIVAALYFYKMRYDPKDPAKKDRDRFLLSKGHAAIVQYAALAEAGFFPREELPKTKSLGAMLQGHPDRLKTPAWRRALAPWARDCPLGWEWRWPSGWTAWTATPTSFWATVRSPRGRSGRRPWLR